MLRSLLLVLLSQWLHSLAAILPSTSIGITSLCSNANCVTRHSFSVTLGASVKSDAKVIVEFPLEYTTTNLGVTTCVGFKVVSGVRSAVPCSVDGRLVTWTFDSLSAGSLDFGLNGVKNPGLSGTTGYFKIWTYMSAYVIETNEVFATVGITPEPVSFSASSLLTTSATINTSQLYEAKVKTSALVPAASWFRVIFPVGFNLNSGLSCTITIQLSTSNVQKLSTACTASETGSTMVNFDPITIAVPAGIDVTLSISGVKNPPATGYPGFIVAQLIQTGGYNLMQISSYMPSPEVLPGLLSNVVIDGAPLNQGQEIWYTITTTVSNPIPKGGYFKVIFPSEFGGVTNCMVNSGFVSLSDTGIVTCNAKRDFNTVWLSDFQDITSGSVSVRVRAINPSIPTCSNFQLQSLLPSGNFIDVNSAAGTLKFAAVALPSTMNIDLLATRVLRNRQEAGPLEIMMQCKWLLPATSLPEASNPANIGQIVVTLPATVQILDGTTDVRATLATLTPPAQLSCLFGKNKDRAMRCEWVNGSNQIVIDTPSNLGLESCPLPLTVAVIGKNEAVLGFNFPALGSQSIKIQTKAQVQASGAPAPVLKEEANFKIRIPPKEFQSATGVTAAGSIKVTYLHAHSGLLNYLKIAIKPSITIASGFILEFEFIGFLADLGSGLAAAQKGPYPCFYDNAWGTFDTCEVEVGTTSSFVRMTSNSSTMTAGTELSVYFPRLTNGAGAAPAVVVRSKTLNSEAIEYQLFTLPALSSVPANPAGAAATISPTSVGTQSTNEQITFSVTLPTPMATNDMLFIRFSDNHFDVTATPKVFTTTECGGTTLANYQQFNGNPVLAYLYTETASSAPISACIKIPETQYQSGSVTVSILVGKTTASTFSIVQSHSLTLTIAADPLANVAVTEMFYDTTIQLVNQPNALYKFLFDTVDDINVGGSVSLLFKGDAFLSVDPCFDLDLTKFPADSVCRSEQNYSYKSATYHRAVISGWASTFPTTAGIIAYVSATTSGTSGPTILEIVANADDQGTSKIINSGTFTLTLGSISTPSVASVNQFVTPKISLRNNEFGPMVFSITPTVALTASTSLTAYSCVKVTRATVGIPNLYDMSAAVSSLSFAPAAGGWLECKFNAVLASKCVIVGDDVIAYTPASLSLPAGTAFTLTLSTQDATAAGEIGFKAPATVGYYQFKVGTYVGSPDVLKEEATPWIYIGAGRFTNVKVTSYNKGAGQFTALRFYFKATTAVAASASGGVVLVEFPFDEMSNGMGWKEDLGSGLPNNSPIDCIAGAGTVASTQFSCTLLWNKVYAPKIKVSNFGAVSAGGIFDFTITGIQNPTAANHELAFKIGSFEYSTATAANPVYTAKDMAFVTVVDTMFAVTANTPAADSAVANTLSVLTYADATANFQVNVPDLTYSITDALLVKVPLDFTLASTLTTCTYFATAPTCIAFPLTGWVLASFTAAPTGAVTQLIFGPVTNPSYAPAITVKVYVLKDRKNTDILTINFPASLTKGALTVTNNLSSLAKVQRMTEMYCFKIQTATQVPDKGSVLITFPAGFTSIDANSCILGGGTSVENSSLNIACVGSGTTLRLYGFKANLLATKFVEACVLVTNPVAATYAAIKYATFKTTDSTIPVDEAQDASTFVITAPPAATAMTSFTAGVQYVPSVQTTFVTGGVNTGPLDLKVTAGTTLTKDAGFVKVTSSTAISLPTNGDLRCIWNDATSEYVTDSCVLAGSAITIKAPKTIDIVATTSYTIRIATINADVQNGLVWAAAGDSVLSIEINSNGSTTYGYARAVVNIGPALLTKLEVDWDQENSDMWNRFTIKLDNAAVAIPTFGSGGRFVVEFPSFYGTLGYVVNHSSVSCVVTGLSVPAALNSPPISCYYEAADATLGTNPAVIVSGFDAVLSSATGIILDFDSIRNPNVSGDDKIVWIQVSAVDVSAGWPGVLLARKRVENLFALRAVPSAVLTSPFSVPQLSVATVTDLGASGAIFSFVMKKPSVNILNDDIYYIVFKQADVAHSGTFGALPASVNSAKYYPFFHFIILKMAAASADVTFQLGGFVNPTYQADDIYYFGYHVQNRQVIAIYQSATGISGLTTINTATIAVTRSDGLTTFYQNDILDWNFKITLVNKLPKNGAVVVTLTSSAFQETFCYSDSAGSLVGTFSCTISGKVATLIPTSNDQPIGTIIIIAASVKNGIANDSVTIFTKSDNTKATYWIEKPAAVAVTVDAASAPVFHEIPVQMHFPKHSVRLNGVAAFSFKVNVKTQLTMNAGLIEVTLPGFGVAAGGTLQCTWALPSPMLAADCTSTKPATDLIVVVKAPKTANIPTGPIDVVISTINADDPEGQGLIYPTTDAKEYTVSISVKSDGTSVSQTAAEPFTLMNIPLSLHSVDYGHRGHAQLNYFKFTFKTSVVITGGIVRFVFPTMDEYGNALFDPDLGLGVACSGPVPCDISGLTGATCSLNCGMPHVDRPASIDVTHTTLFAGTDTYTVSFDGVKNPTAPGTDDRLLYFRVLIYDTAAKVVTSSTNYFVMSVLTNGSVDSVATGGLAVFTGTPFIATASLDLTMPTSLVQDVTSKLILVVPFTLSATDVVNNAATAHTSGEVHAGTNWVVIKQSNGITPRVVFAGTSLAAIYVGASVRLMHIKGDLLVGDYSIVCTSTANFIAGGLLTATPIFPSSTGKMNTSQLSEIVVSYALAKPVPAGGCIVISFASATTDIDTSLCMASHAASASFGGSWKCAIAAGATPKTLTFTGLASLTTADNIKVMTRAKFSSTNIGGITIKTYANSACTYQIEKDDNAATTVPTIVGETADPAQPIIYFKPPAVISRLAVKSTTADFSFNFTPRTALVAASSHHLKFSATFPLSVQSTMASPSCSISTGSTKIPAPCAFAAAGDLNIYPGADLAAGTTYKVELTTQGELNGANGFKQAATNAFQDVTLQTYTSMDETTPADNGILRFATPDAAFASLKITRAHESKGYMNIYKFDIASIAFTATDYLVVDFPTATEDGSIAVFADDLGLGLASGSPIAVDVTGYAPTSCIFKRGSNALKIPAVIKCTGAIVAAAGTITLKIPAVSPNPADADADKAIANFRVHIEDVSRKVLAERWVLNAFAEDKTAPTSTADPVASWDTSTPAAGATAKINIAITTHAEVIAIGTGISLTTTSSTLNYKNSAMNLVHITGLSAPSAAIAGLTAPASTVVVKVKALALKANTDGKMLVDQVYETTLASPTAVAAVAAVVITSTAANGGGVTGTNAGSWMLQDLSISAGVDIPGTTNIVFEIVGTTGGTFADVDPGFFRFKSGFASEGIYWKYIESSGAKKFQISSFSTLTTGTTFVVQVYAKISSTATANTFKAVVYTSSTLTDVWGEGTSVAVAPTTTTAALALPLSITLTAGSFKVGATITEVVVTLTLGFQLTFVVNSGVSLDLTNTELGCTGSVTLSTVKYGSVAGTLPVFTSSVAYGDVPALIPVGSTTVTYTFTTAFCTPTVAGYQDLKVTTKDATVVKEIGYGRIFILPSVVSPTFTMETYVTNQNSWTMVHATFKPATGGLAVGDMIVFSFPVAQTAGGFAVDLGLGGDSGQEIPFTATPANINTCWLSKGSTALVSDAKINCKIKTITADTETLDITFVKIKTPATGGATATFGVYVYSTNAYKQSASATNPNAFITTGTCSQTGTAAATLTTSTYYSSSSYTVSFTLSGSQSASANDYLLVEMGSTYDLSALTIGGVVVSKIDSPAPCPCVLVKLASTATAPSFTLAGVKNPGPAVTSSFNVYPNLVSTRKCADAPSITVTLTPLTFTSPAVTNFGPASATFNQNQDCPIAVSFTTPSKIPTTASIVLKFPTATFDPIQTFHVETSLTTSSAFTYAIQNTDELAISGFNEVAAAAVVTVKYLYVPVKPAATAGPVTITMSAVVSTTTLASVTQSITVTALSYLRSTQYYPKYVSLFGKDSSDPNGATTNVFLVLHFKTTAAIVPADAITIVVPGDIFKGSTGTRLFALFVGPARLMAHSVTRAYTTTTAITIKSPASVGLATSTEYDVIVGANNFDADGLLFQATGVNDVKVSSVETGVTHVASGLCIPGASVFGEFYVQPFTLNLAQEKPYLIHFKTLTAITSANGEIVVQFPVDTQFDANPFAITAQGAKVNCLVKTGPAAATVATPVCRAFAGEVGSSYRNPATIIISGVAASANDLVDIVISSVKAPPTAGLIADVTVFTQELTADVPSVKHYMTYRNAVITQGAASAAVAQPWASITKTSTTVSASGNYVIALSQANFDIDTILVVFPSVYNTMAFLGASTVTTPASVKYYAVPSAGQLLIILPARSLKSASTLTITITAVSNVSYIPVTASDAVITVYTSASRQFVMSTTPFSGSIPTTPWTEDTATMVSLLTNGSVPNTEASVIVGLNTNYALVIKFPTSDIPQDGVVLLEFPAEFQSVGNVVYATVTGGILKCANEASSKVWNCPAKVAIAKNTNVTIYGRAQNPATAAASSNFKISAYVDSGKTKIIAKNYSAGTVTTIAGTKVSVPDDFYVPHQVILQETPIKAGEKDSITWTFKPSSSFDVGTGAVIATPDSATGFTYDANAIKVAIFYDMSVTPPVGYMASSCTEASGVLTINTPKTKVIDLNKLWKLMLHTSNGLHPQYPANTVATYNWAVELKYSGTLSHKFQEVVFNVKAKPAVCKLTPAVAHINQPNAVYELVLDADIALSSAAYISLIFPLSVGGSPAFDRYLGQTTNLGADFGCSSAGLTGSLNCIVDPSAYTYNVRNTVQIDIDGVTATHTVGTAITIYFTGIKNPATVDKIQWFAVRVGAASNFVASYAKLQAIFQTTAAPTITATHGVSFVSKLATAGQKVDSTAAATTGFTLGVAVSQGDYIVLVFPHNIDSGSAVTTYGVATIVSQKTILCKATAAITNTGLFDMTGLVAPSYVQTPVLKAYIYSKQAEAYEVWYDTTPTAYTPYTVTVNAITLPGSATAYFNVLTPYLIDFKLEATIATKAGFKVTFPTGFTLGSICRVTTWVTTLSLKNQGYQACEVSGSTALVDFGNVQYTADDSVKVLVFATPGATFTSPLTVTVDSYVDSPTRSNKNGTGSGGSQAVVANPANIVVSSDPYVGTAMRTVARGDDYGSLTFTFKSTVTLVKNSGVLEVTLKTTLAAVTLAAPGTYRCVWIDSTLARYLAASCSFTVNAAGDVLAITAPATTDIPLATTWTVQANTIMQASDGFKFSSAITAGYYSVAAQTKGTGTALGDSGSSTIFLAPKLATNAMMKYFSSTAGMPTALEFTIKPSVAVPAGEEGAAGTSHIVISFDVDVMGPSLGSTIVSQTDQTDGIGLTDCASINTFGATTKCYIRRGDVMTKRTTDVIVRNYAAIATTASAQLLITPLFNPVVGKILHVRVAVCDYAAGVYSYLQYQEFNFFYMTSAAPAVDTAGTATYGATTVQGAATTLDFTTTASPMPSNTNSGLVLFMLSESLPSLTGAAIATHTLYNLPIHRALAVVPVGAALVSPIPFTSVPLPVYATSQTWAGYFMSSQLIVKYQTYAASITSASLATANIVVNFVEGLKPLAGPVPAGPFIKRVNQFSFRIKPQLKIPEGGEIRITFNSALGNAANSCLIDGGLQGAYQCAYAGTQVMRIYGFTAYDGTVATTPAIMVVISTTATTTAASASLNFSVATYGKAGTGTLVTTIESGSTPMTLEVKAAVDVLNARMPPMFKSQTFACLGQYTDLTFNLKPRAVPYLFKYKIAVQFFHTANLPAGSSVTCLFSNGVTTYPSEGGCAAAWAASKLTVTATVPEQISLTPNNQYSLTFSVQDSGALATDGFKLPTASEVATLPNPGKPYFYLTAFQADGTTLKEAQKMIQFTCGEPLSSVAFSLGTTKLASDTYLDLSFKVANAVPISGEVIIEFPTHNGVGNLFPIDLGVGSNSPTDISCDVVSGTATWASPKCTVYPATAVGPTTPVSIKISKLNVILATADTQRILIGKVRTPAQAKDPIFSSEALISRIRIYSKTSPFIKSYAANEGIVRYPASFSTAPTSTVAGTVATDATFTATDGKTVTYTFTTGLTSVDLNNGVIVLDLGLSFLLPSSVTCGGASLTCSYLKITGLGWLIATISVARTAAITTLTAALRSPEWNVATGYPIRVMTYNSAGDWFETSTATLAALTPQVGNLASVTCNFSLNTNTYDVYTITITPVAQSTLLKRVQIKFPAEYQWVDSTCKVVSGLNVISATSPIICVSDCITNVCTNTITITNFSDTTATDNIVVKVGAMSPAVKPASGNTGNFEVRLMGLPTGTDGTIELKAALPQAITDVDFPFFTWVDPVKTVLYDRWVKAGSSGDIYVRMEPKIPIPAGTGSIQLQLPTGFAPATGSTPVCLLQHGMLYYTADPLWTSRSDITIPAPCTWSSTTNTVTVAFPATRPKEWTGFGKRCSTLIVTSVTATMTMPGFTAPVNPGFYTATVTTYSGTTVLENSTPSFYVNPPELDKSTSGSTYTMTSLTTSATAENILKIKFTTTRDAPVGYLTFVKNVPQEIATIELQFETFQSFLPDLGLGYKQGSSVPCAAMSPGLVPKNQLQCTFIPGDTTATTPVPARVLVNSFEAVKAATVVELHLLRFKNPTYNVADSYGFKPKIWVTMYKTSADGIVTGLAYPTLPYTRLPAVTNDLPSATAVSGSTNVLSLTPKTVDGTGILKIPLRLTTAMAPGDLIYLSFPGTWLNLPTTGLSVSIQNYAVPATPVAAIATPDVLIYPSASVITIGIPAAFTGTLIIANDYQIDISGFVNPPYLDSCTNCPMWYYTTVSQVIKNTYPTVPPMTTGNFWTDLGFANGEVSGFSFTATSLKVDAINMKYDVKFTTVPRVPAGATLQVILPSDFPILSGRSPAATCTTKLTGATCAIFGNGVSITGFAALKNTSLVELTILGGKNPGSVGTISGFVVMASSSAGKTIIGQTVTYTITTVAADAVSAYAFTLTPKSFTAGISTNYYLKASAANALPIGTVITLTLPIDFSIAIDLKCMELAGISSYQSCSITNNNSITLVLNDSLAASASISVTLVGIKNPLLTTTTLSQKFGPIALKAVYDGATLSVSSNTATTSFLTITQPPVNLRPYNFLVSPLNEAEIGLYTVSITAPMLLTSGDSYAIRVLFPKTYTRTLVPAGTQLYCSATPAMQKCGVIEPNEVRFEVFLSDVAVSSRIDLTIFGVANPVLGDTGQFSMQIVKQTDGSVIASTDTAGAFRILAAPSQAFFLALAPDDLYAGGITTYNLRIDTNVTTLAKNGTLWIDWPKEYQGLFLKTNYDCQVVGTNIVSSTCTWLPQTNYMRTQILLPAPTATNQRNTGVTQKFSVKFFGISNPKTSGQTAPFRTKYVDLDNNLVISSSFENMGNNTITFKAGYQSISIPTIEKTIVQGTYSDLISLDLGLSSYDPVRIMLSSDIAGLVFSPAELVLQYAWNTKTTFRVGAIGTAKVGAYRVIFTKYESNTVQRFQPLSDLKINVQARANSLPVTIGKILDTSVSVTTLPISVTLAAPTLYPLTVVLFTGQSTNITITPSILAFAAGSQFANFTMAYSSQAVSGQVYGQVIGDGSAAFQTLTNNVSFVVIPTQTQPVSLLFANVTTIGRVSATAELQFSGLATVWFMYAPKGTRQPSASQIQSQTPVKGNAKQSFGTSLANTIWSNTTANSTYYSAYLSMTDLKDNANYLLFYVFQGPDSVLSNVSQLGFKTMKSYPPAKFTVYTIVITNPQTVLLAVCQALGIPCTLLLYVGSTAATNSSRLLQSDVPYQFVMTMDRGQDAASPQDQVALLDSPIKKNLLQQYLPTFSPAPSISATISAYNYTTPVFITSPEIDIITNSTVTIRVTQNVAGQIYGVMLDRTGAQPSSDQITQCLDGNNDPVLPEHCTIADTFGNVTSWLKFTNLQYFRRYRVWLAGTNNLPGFPANTPDDQIGMLNLTAGKLLSTKIEQTILYTWSDSGLSLLLAFASLYLV